MRYIMAPEIVNNPNDFSFFIELGEPLSKAKSIIILLPRIKNWAFLFLVKIKFKPVQQLRSENQKQEPDLFNII